MRYAESYRNYCLYFVLNWVYVYFSEKTYNNRILLPH